MKADSFYPHIADWLQRVLELVLDTGENAHYITSRRGTTLWTTVITPVHKFINEHYVQSENMFSELLPEVEIHGDKAKHIQYQVQFSRPGADSRTYTVVHSIVNAAALAGACAQEQYIKYTHKEPRKPLCRV
jgi:hypothetical protein